MFRFDTSPAALPAPEPTPASTPRPERVLFSAPPRTTDVQWFRSALDADGTPHAPRALLIMACLAAIGATTWSAVTHSMLLYGDARAHLNVARHVTDGLRPGLSQLGSVWLPMAHLLMVPFAAVRPLWRSGMAGAIVGGACFTYASVRIFTIVRELAASDIAAWCAFALFIANANLLYAQSTALTEPVLLAFLIGACYHLVHWMRTFSFRSLVWAAVLTVCATLTRYEGWALLLMGLVVVAAWGRRYDRRQRSPEASFVLFLAVGGYGIVLWLIYNLTIFGDALYFLHSQYSAQAINGGQAQFGLLGTKGNLVESVLTYGWDSLDVVGPALVIAALVATLVILARRHPERRRTIFTLALLGAPAAFEIVSLYAGQTTIRVPQRAPHGMWNDRYGLIMLPVCVVAVGVLVGRRRILGAAAFFAGLVAAAAIAIGTPLTLADGRTGTSSAAAGHPERAAAFLGSHYAGGEVLLDDSAASAFMFATGLDLKEFVSPGFHPFWDRALVAPAQHVQWVVSVPGDSVTNDERRHPSRFADFRLTYKDGDVSIYERVARPPASNGA